PGDAAVVLQVRRLADAERCGQPILAILEAGLEPALEPSVEAGREGQLTLDAFNLQARLGRCWAAGDLRDLAAAVLTGRRGALPDGRPWPTPAAGEPRRMHVAPGSAAIWDPYVVALRPVPAPSEVIPFAGASVEELDDALAQGRI